MIAIREIELPKPNRAPADGHLRMDQEAALRDLRVAFRRATETGVLTKLAHRVRSADSLADVYDAVGSLSAVQA